MKVIIVNPGQNPQIEDIKVIYDEFGCYDSFREILGEAITLEFPLLDTVMLVHNECGRELGLPANRKVFSTGASTMDSFIHGSFLLCNLNDKGDPCSLTNQQIEACMGLLEAAELPSPEQIV